MSGILEPGEEPAPGVMREVGEETGIRVVVERLVAVTVSPKGRHPNGDRARYLVLVFACRPADPQQEARVADEESLEVGWLAADALPPVRASVRGCIAPASAEVPRTFFTPT